MEDMFVFTNPIDEMQMSFSTLTGAVEEARKYIGIEDMEGDTVEQIVIFKAVPVSVVKRG